MLYATDNKCVIERVLSKNDTQIRLTDLENSLDLIWHF